MANTFINPTIIAKRALMILKQKLIASQFCIRAYETEFAQKVGETIKIKTRPTFTANEFGAGINSGDISAQDITESSIELKIEHFKDVSVALGAREKTFNFDDFSRTIVEPATYALAQSVDNYVLDKTKDVYQSVSISNKTMVASGSHNIDLASVAELDKKFEDINAPDEGRVCLIGSSARSSMLADGDFVSAEKTGWTDALRRANLGSLLNMEFYSSPNVKTATKGTATALTSAGTNAAGGSSIVCDGAGNAKTITRGQLLTFAGTTQQFTVTGTYNSTTQSYDDHTSDSSGNVTINVSPTIPTGGIANDSAATFVDDNHQINVGMVSQTAMALVCIPPEAPEADNASVGTAYEDGLGIRVTMGYDLTTKKDTISFDLLMGAKVIQPEHMFRF